MRTQMSAMEDDEAAAQGVLAGAYTCPLLSSEGGLNIYPKICIGGSDMRIAQWGGPQGLTLVHGSAQRDSLFVGYIG
jgi:hypothetical protein